MKILLLAPQPFYQERGTPIAIRLLVETLCEQQHSVDLLTINEGENISIKGLRIFRIPKIPFIKKIPIGFSFKKLIADFFFTFYMLFNLNFSEYDVIHAVEESIFPAVVCNMIWKKKLVYDMDSSLVEQLYEKWRFLKYLSGILNFFEKWAIKSSDIIVPVCSYLAEKAKLYKSPEKIFLLEDIAFENEKSLGSIDNIREQFNIKSILVLYIGNLEHYQGIDLMLEGIGLIDPAVNFNLVIIGGSMKDIQKYKSKSEQLNISGRVHFMGPKPFVNLQFYLRQADILVSPRIAGKNTPMKIYSYLSSGKTILATNIESHTQVLDHSCAYLVNPESKNFSIGLSELIENKELREKLGKNGKELALKNYSRESYRKKVEFIYSGINVQQEFFQVLT